MRNFRQTVWLSAVAVLVLVLAVWVATRQRPVPSPIDLPPPAIPVPPPAPAVPGSPMAQPTPAKPLAAELQSGKAPETTADDQNKPPVTEEPSETLDSSWDFTPEELAAEPTEFVSIGLGKYQVRSGDEFNVKVTLKGPPLQAAVLALVFDRSVVEPVPDSGAAVGSVFRKGVEFFIHPTEGRAALFCATQPGKKNVLGARDEVVASFRMRAKAAGKTTISADDKGLKFVGGSGTEIRSEVLAGEVTVTP